MLTLETQNYTIHDSNIIYSKNPSRPSKSLVDAKMYNKYDNLDIYRDLISVGLKECLNYFEIPFDNIKEDYLDFNDEKYIILEDKEIEEVLFLFTKHDYKNMIIQIKDLYNYPKIQFMYIMATYFLETDVFFSSYNNCVYILCTERNSKKKITFKCGENIKDFGIKIPYKVLKYIYNYNNRYFSKMSVIKKYIIDNFDKIDTVNKEISLIIEYYRKLICKDLYMEKCQCNNLFKSGILNCYICEECKSLILIDYFLDFDHASPADLNAAL